MYTTDVEKEEQSEDKRKGVIKHYLSLFQSHKKLRVVIFSR